MATERNMSVELYRALMMLGICMIHGFGVGMPRTVPAMRVIQSLLLFCVCGFVFLSGYYGIRFKLIKIIRLYGLGLFGAIVSSVGYALWGDGSFGSAWHHFAFTFKDYWFLNAYAILMLMAPALNLALASCRKPEVWLALILLIVGTVGCSFVAQLPLMRSYFPASPGLHDYSGFMFMGIYVFAGLWREYDLGRFITARWLFVTVPLMAIYPLSLGGYSSPFSILTAAILFSKMQSLHLPKQWGGVSWLFLRPRYFLFT